MNSVDVANDAANLEVLAEVGLELVWLAIYGYVVYRLDRHVRLKGYQSPFRGLSMVGAYLVAVGFGFYSSFSAPGTCARCSPAANPEYFRPELVWEHVWLSFSRFWLVATLGMAVLAGAAFAVPRRARRFGSRRVKFPWRAAAYLWLILTAVPLFAWWAGKISVSSVWRLGILCIGAYKSCDYLASRTRSKGMEEALHEDPRAPVVYLRAFDAEEEMFAALSYDESQKLEVPMRNPTAWRHPATLEEYFAREILRSTIVVASPGTAEMG